MFMAIPLGRDNDSMLITIAVGITGYMLLWWGWYMHGKGGK
jgi:hypothetical protein